MTTRTADHNPASGSILPSFLRDIRVLQALGQIIFVILVVAGVSALVASIFSSLAAKNLTPTFNFLNDRAGFDISRAPSWYSSNSNYGTAFTVGLINTLRVVSLGLVLTTLLGILVGILLLSSNWLLRMVARAYVELLRNTPLLAQLYVWYFIVMVTLLPPIERPLTFPSEGITVLPWRLLVYIILFFGVRYWLQRSTLPARQRGFVLPGLLALFVILEVLHILPNAGLRLELYPAAYISKRGFVVPEIVLTDRFLPWLVIVVIGIVAAIGQWIYLGRVTENTGRRFPRGWYTLTIIAIAVVVGWFVVSLAPPPATVTVDQNGTAVEMPLQAARDQNLLTAANEPQITQQPLLVVLPLQRVNKAGVVSNNFDRGSEIAPEYMALLLGLVVYTSAFIAEIVRAGITAVPRGQLEASRALGLSTTQMLQLIILPQALRVIIPPLGNQFLNLSKNSSLAVAIAYADVVFVTSTIMNQSGQSVTGIVMEMAVYLIISLLLSALTNLFNRRFRLITR